MGLLEKAKRYFGIQPIIYEVEMRRDAEGNIRVEEYNPSGRDAEQLKSALERTVRKKQ